jgi:hypothetical protein
MTLLSKTGPLVLLFSLFALVTSVTSCAPKAKPSLAAKKLLEDDGVSAQYPGASYAPSAALFTFFNWPSEADLQSIQEKHTSLAAELTRKLQQEQAILDDLDQRLERVGSEAERSEILTQKKQSLEVVKQLKRDHSISSEIAQLHTLDDLYTHVGEQSTLLDNVFIKNHDIDRNLKLTRSQKAEIFKTFKTETEARFGQELQMRSDYLARYACLISFWGTNNQNIKCDRLAQATDPKERVRTPQSCENITDKSLPYYKMYPGLKLKKAFETCQKEIPQLPPDLVNLEAAWARKYPELNQKLLDLEKERQAFDIAYWQRFHIEFTQKAVEPNTENIAKSKYWMDTSPLPNTRIKFDSEGQVESMTLFLQINNLSGGDNSENRHLYYKYQKANSEAGSTTPNAVANGSETRDIEDLKMIERYGVRVISFRLNEKEALLDQNQGERYNGNYYTIELSENPRPFGLTFTDKMVTKYSPDHRILNYGVMKFIFNRNE